MDEALTTIRDQQKDIWNKFSAGWKKYDEFTMKFLKPSGDVIIRELDIQETDLVLDVASGTGEPGLTIAKLAAKGKVIGTDLSEQMLAIADEHAKEKGIENYETIVSDISELPFSNDHFNKLSCRMGFMFFPDMQMAANEMYRVLKNGGKLATSVWDEAGGNPWITIIMNVIKENVEMPVPPQGAPGMFRCAGNIIRSVLENAGFKNIREFPVKGKIEYGSIDFYWKNMTEIAAPIVGALSKTDDMTREKIKAEVYRRSGEVADDSDFKLDFSAVVYSADK